MIIGLPLISDSGLPGSLVDAYLAGMQPMMLYLCVMLFLYLV